MDIFQARWMQRRLAADDHVQRVAYVAAREEPAEPQAEIDSAFAAVLAGQCPPPRAGDRSCRAARRNADSHSARASVRVPVQTADTCRSSMPSTTKNRGSGS